MSHFGRRRRRARRRFAAELAAPYGAFRVPATAEAPVPLSEAGPRPLTFELSPEEVIATVSVVEP